VKAAPDNVEKRASWATFPCYRWFGIKLSPLFDLHQAIANRRSKLSQIQNQLSIKQLPKSIVASVVASPDYIINESPFSEK
jgi:hypothetical protein